MAIQSRWEGQAHNRPRGDVPTVTTLSLTLTSVFSPSPQVPCSRGSRGGLEGLRRESSISTPSVGSPWVRSREKGYLSQVSSFAPSCYCPLPSRPTSQDGHPGSGQRLCPLHVCSTGSSASEQIKQPCVAWVSVKGVHTLVLGHRAYGA